MQPKIIRMSKWALDNMTVEPDEGGFVAVIKVINIHGRGYNESEALLMAVECVLDLYDILTEHPENHYAGPALEQRKILVDLFGESDEQMQAS